MLNMIDTFCQFLQTINHEQQLYVIDLEIEIFGIVISIHIYFIDIIGEHSNDFYRKFWNHCNIECWKWTMLRHQGMWHEDNEIIKRKKIS